MKSIADLHIHTVASGHAYNTISEMATAADLKNLKMIAMTDHGPKIPGGPHYYHFSNLKAIPKMINGVRILKGVEANIIDEDGTLDLEREVMEKLEIVLIGAHKYCTPNNSIEENTDMFIKAMQNEFVDIFVHTGNPEYAVNYERLVIAAAELGVAIEVNESSLTITRVGSEVNCEKIIKLCKKYKVKVALGSDSHFVDRVGVFEKSLELLKRCQFPQDMVLNFQESLILEHIGHRRKKVVK